MKSHSAFLLIITVSLLVGCGHSLEADYSKLDLVSVSGRVTLDGNPLAKVTVIFESPDKTYSSGVTDDAGNYTLMYDTIKSGCLSGPKIVRIKDRVAGEGEEEAPSENPDGSVAKPKDSIPACYGTKSQLQATVEGSSQTLNFDLKSDCSIKGPST